MRRPDGTVATVHRRQIVEPKWRDGGDNLSNSVFMSDFTLTGFRKTGATFYMAFSKRIVLWVHFLAKIFF